MTNMGIKKLSEASMKISKKQDDKRQPLNSLIKVLRPKVYITDSSSFKSLVQELTGNGNIHPISSPPPVNGTTSPIMEFQEDDDHDPVFQEPTADSSPQFGVPITSPEPSPPVISSDNLLHHDYEITDFSALRDFESWLLEIDNFPYCDGYSPFAHQQEVCVNGYM